MSQQMQALSHNLAGSDLKQLAEKLSEEALQTTYEVSSNPCRIDSLQGTQAFRASKILTAASFVDAGSEEAGRVQCAVPSL